MTEKENQLLIRITSCLDENSRELIEELAEIKKGTIGLREGLDKSSISFLDFEFNPDGFSISLYPMDSDWTQLGYKSLLKKYPNGIIRDKNLDLDLDDYDFDDEQDMERMDNFHLKLEQTFIHWFVDCWAKSGEIEPEFTFYLAQHDSDKSLDLSKNEWIQNKYK